MNLSHRLAAALGSRYRLEREIGAGGMATVFLAQDIRHERPVAIKVLHESLAAALGPARFLAEIRTTARLQHPNILPLLDSGEADGLLYYVMPFVAGETLRQRIEREGQLPLPDAVRIAREVADALGAAHAAGVVHRDIKPENILLGGGHAMVADFGVALALEQAGGERITQSGLAVGTPQYMSPEQASAERTVDGRSDLYSLGSVLYEMVAGEPPFTGPTVQAVIARRMHDTPRPMRSVRPEVPAALERTVSRSLATAPADRYQTAAELIAALDGTDRASAAGSRRAVRIGVAVVLLAGAALATWRATTKSGPGPMARSVAVLPFANTGTSKDDEYIGDGLTDEVAAALGRVNGLRVAARSSAFQFKGRNIDATEVGRRLGVAVVLEGAIRRSGDTLHVTAQLVNSADGLSLWSGRYDRAAAQVFSIQDDIARQVAERFQLSAGGAGQGTANAAAWDALSRGRFLLARRDRESVFRSVDLFQQAIGLDSGYARAWAGLGEAYNILGIWEHAPPDVVIPVRARSAIDRALRIDSTLADAHTALGVIHLFYDWNWAGARAAFNRALALDPRYSEARLFRGWLALAEGHPEQAVADLEEATREEPAAILLNVRLATMLRYAGRTGEALAQLTRAAALDSTSSILKFERAETLAESGRYGESLTLLDQDLVEKRKGYGSGARGFVLARLGRRADALAEIRQLEADTTRPYVTAPGIATIYAGLGERDRAFEWLERAYRAHSWTMLLLRQNAQLASLRSDPRWASLVAKLRFP